MLRRLRELTARQGWDYTFTLFSHSGEASHALDMIYLSVPFHRWTQTGVGDDLYDTLASAIKHLEAETSPCQSPPGASSAPAPASVVEQGLGLPGGAQAAPAPAYRTHNHKGALNERCQRDGWALPSYTSVPRVSGGMVAGWDTRARLHSERAGELTGQGFAATKRQSQQLAAKQLFLQLP